MFIQKVFHIHRTLGETKARLCKATALFRSMAGVEKATITDDGVGQFACTLPSGLHAHCVLIGLPTEDANQILFKSTAGNVDVAGLVEFVTVTDDVTEVHLTMEYSFKAVWLRVLDRMNRCMERFFHTQIAYLKKYLETQIAINGPTASSGAVFSPALV